MQKRRLYSSLSGSFFSLFVLIWISSCEPTTSVFDSSDVQSTQKILGVEFTKTEIDTMLTYLERNRKGFDSMRAIPLGNEVFPAVLFDPLPMDFQLPTLPASVNQWPIPQVIRPERDEDLAFCGIPQLAALLRSGQLTSVELTELYLDRLERFDTLEAVITLTTEMALEHA
ncbi:MAG: amidase, partial [Bacteroidota bacterium]